MEKITKARIDGVNADFDSQIASFKGIAISVKKTMPLLAKSIELDVMLIETYKKAFNATATKQ